MGLFNFFENKRKKEEEMARYHIPVKFHHYTKEILVRGVDRETLMALIREEMEVTDEPMPIESFQVEAVKDSDWYHIHCADNFDFYGFHHLVNWLYKYEEDRPVIMAIGLAKHSYKDEASYYVVQDIESKWGDTLVGVMNNDKALSIYLPGCSVEGGNMMAKDNGLNGVKMRQYLASYNLEAMASNIKKQ